MQSTVARLRGIRFNTRLRVIFLWRHCVKKIKCSWEMKWLEIWNLNFPLKHHFQLNLQVDNEVKTIYE